MKYKAVVNPWHVTLAVALLLAACQTVQTTLAERSGVSLASLRRFEESGRISLESLLDLAFALHRLDDFESLLKPPPARSIAELEEAEKRPERKRGRL